MKATIDKSKVMSRAWRIYRSGVAYYSLSFSLSLSRAWELEKAEIAYERRKAEEAAEKAARPVRRQSHTFSMAGCAEYYAGARPGQYFGD